MPSIDPSTATQEALRTECAKRIQSRLDDLLMAGSTSDPIMFSAKGYR